MRRAGWLRGSRTRSGSNWRTGPSEEGSPPLGFARSRCAIAALDAYYGNAIIEFENSLRKTEGTALRQLREYAAGVWGEEGDGDGTVDPPE
jgi:hypothetical protein